jgi:DNA polymerase-3 subunit beta
MKILCTQENLIHAISILERVVGKQSTLPILGNFLLETNKGRLKLSATNLEIGVIAYVGAKIEREGRITVPAKLLSNFIHNIPAQEVVSFEIEGNFLKVVSGGYEMKIRGLDAKDFPLIPQYNSEYFFSLPAQILRNAFSRLLPCVSLTDSRLELTGVHCLFLEKEIHFAATDSFRLGEEIFSLDGMEKNERYQSFIQEHPSFIVPAETLHELQRSIMPESDRVGVALHENQLFFQVDDIQIISRLINGKYPDYKQIIPSRFSCAVSFDRETLLRAVRVGSVFSSSSSGEILFKILPKEGKVIISSLSQEIGENKVMVMAQIDGGDEMEISFHPKYILDGLNILQGERVVFQCNTPHTPVALRMVDGERKDTFLYIVMPIRK